MIKWLSKIFFLLMFFQAPSAVALFFGPGMPTFDGATDALFGTEIVGTTMSNINTGLIMEVQGNIQDIKSKYKEYKNDYEGVMLKEKAPLEGTRTIQTSSLGNPADPNSTRLAMYELFMVQPSNDFLEQREYQAQGTQMYLDTIIEINTAVKRLEQEYNNNLKPKLETMSEDLLTGENGAEVGDNENASWKNNYNAYKTFDDLVQILEELTALKAQYVAIKAMKFSIEPVSYSDAQSQSPSSSGDSTPPAAEKTSFLPSQPTIELASSAQYSHSETLAFAQQSTSYNPDANGIVTFVDAPVPDIDSPFADSRAELKDIEKLNPIYNTAVKTLSIHNLIQSLPSKKALFDKYKQYQRLHDKSVEKVKESDACVLRYLSKYYQDPEQTWYGAYIGDQITDYDLRKGLSGWAITSFETAKAATANPVDEADLAEMQFDETMDSTDFDSFADQQPYIEEQVETFDGYKTQSKYDETDSDTRVSELLPWNIGAEAAKELADDQRSDSPQWGTPIQAFPVWNDQKSFYGQYLDGKYANIKYYLSRFDFRARVVLVAQVLNSLSSAKPPLKAAAANILSSLEGKTQDIPEIPEDGNLQITQAAAEKKQAVDLLQKNLEPKLKELEQLREDYTKELDTAQTKQDELNRELNRAQNPNMNSDLQIPEGADPESIEAELKTVNQQIEDLQNKIAEVDKQIDNLRKAYVRKEQNIEYQYNTLISSIKDPALQEITFSSLSNYGIVVAASPQLQSYISSLLNTSTTIFNDVKDYAQEETERTRQAIYNLGDKIYFPSGETEVVALHAELIRKLKFLPFENLASFKPSVLKIARSEEAVSLVSTAFQNAFVGTICPGDNCMEADSDYFVGASAKIRDFMAPKGAPATTSAPMREIVHLDYIDYTNIPQLSDGSVAKADILKYGQPIPDVWQYILKNPAYVEKEIDFAKILNLGGEARNFLRGGVLPCHDDKYIIDATDDKASYYVVSDKSSPYAKCLFLSTSTNKLKAAAGGAAMAGGAVLVGLAGFINNVTVTNQEAEKDKSVDVEKSGEIFDDSFSELGTFFTYENSKFFIRKQAQTAYKRLGEIQSDATKEDYKENIPDNIYKKAAFSENQIGNFLRFVETEQDYRQILEELSAKMEETKAELFADFAEAGFTPSDDFDLSDPDDYAQARQTLDDLKNNNLSLAQTKVDEISNPTNNVVKDRRDRILNILNALSKDEDELLNLSEDITPDASFDERLKSEAANQATAQKYQEEADKAFENQLNSFPAPYCAAY